MASNKEANAIIKAKDAVVAKVKDITAEDIIMQAVKVPGVKVNRDKFLHKELIKYYPESVVQEAIAHNPAYAGIERKRINYISRQVVNYETNKVSAISFVAGLPGGVAMAATVPADVAQYFGFMLRTMQKLAYLYGFPDFELNEDNISDGTMNQILVFFGVMFGVQGANAGVKKIAAAAAQKVSKSLAQKALTKGTIYPIVKKIAQAVGIKMTKQIFAESVSKIVPVVGGVVTGGLSYLTFKPCAKKLRNSFMELPLSDPDFYKEKEEVIDVNVTDEVLESEEHDAIEGDGDE
jgi:hypothetical protein